MAKIFKKNEDQTIIGYSFMHGIIYAALAMIVSFTIISLIYVFDHQFHDFWWIPAAISVLIFIIVFIYVFFTEKNAETPSSNVKKKLNKTQLPKNKK